MRYLDFFVLYVDYIRSLNRVISRFVPTSRTHFRNFCNYKISSYILCARIHRVITSGTLPSSVAFIHLCRGRREFGNIQRLAWNACSTVRPDKCLIMPRTARRAMVCVKIFWLKQRNNGTYLSLSLPLSLFDFASREVGWTTATSLMRTIHRHAN